MLKKIGGVLALLAGIALLGWLGYTVFIVGQVPRRAIGGTIGGIALIGWGIKWLREEMQ